MMTKKKVEKVIAEKPKKNGRPTKYSEALGEEICNALGNSVDGITRICKANPHFPEPETIRDWRHKNQSFSAKYEAAKLKQALGFAEGIIDIVDDNSNDIMMTDKGPAVNSAAIQRDRLRMDARKWIACKLLPKVYGDKVQQEVTVIKHEDTIDALK